MKRRFNASAKRATTKASESNKTLTITIPKESETMKTKIKATSSGKLHLSNFEDSAICVKNNKPMKFVETLSNKIALKADKSAFCKRCFGDEDPHKVIKEMIKLAGDDESKRAPVKKKLTTVDATETMRALNEKAKKDSAKKESPIEKGDSQIEALYKMIDKLDAFARDDENNTRYMRLKTSCYIEALESIKEMIETGDVEALNRLIL